MRFFEKTFVCLPFVLFLAVLAYSNTFGAPFAFDDMLLFINKRLGNISSIPSLFWDIRNFFGSRPLLLATISLNYYFGGADTWGYHAVNLALHLLNGALLYLLVRMTGIHLGYGEKDIRHAALFSAALFVLHPAQTEAVTTILGRSVLLATTFYLSGMVFFLKTVTAEKRKPIYFVCLLLTSLLGMASRENFATFPFMLVLYDMFFISRFRFKEALKHYKAYAPALLSLGYLAYLVLNATYDPGTDSPGVGLPHRDYFLTQFRVHWTYLRLLALPINQNVDYDYPIATSLWEFPALISFLGYAGLFAGSIAFARKRPVPSFAVLWFLITLTPISFLVTLMDLRLDDVIFEHRLYLPGTAFFALAGVAAVIAIKGLANERLRKATVALAVILPLLLAAATFKRNSVWQSEVSLWEDAAVKSPRKARPHNNLGDAFSKIDQFDRAIEEFRIALELKPDYKIARSSLGLISNQIAIKRNPNDAVAYFNLGTIYSDAGLLGKAIEQYRTAIRLKPDYVAAHNDLGAILADSGKLDEAIEHFQAAISFDPEDAAAHNNLGMAYRMKGLPDKAEEHFRIAGELAQKR